MARTILALDSGGTAVKAALYDLAGHELARAGEVMQPLLPAPGQNERNPGEMWLRICACIRRIIAEARVDANEIAAVGLTSYGNGICLVDANGMPVRNAVLSTDQRAGDIVAQWRAAGAEERHIALGYQRLWAGKPLPLLAWIERHEPDVLDRAAHILMCKDYLRFRLTGVCALEVSDASSGSLYDQSSGRRWNPTMLKLLGLEKYERLFGELLEPLSVAGTVTPEAAEATGLKAGTPVSAGYADGPAMLLAMGVVDESLLHVVSGTWGLNQLLSRNPVKDGSIMASICAARPGEFVLVESSVTSASAFEWFVDTVLAKGPGAPDPASLYAWCNREIAKAKDSDPAVYFLPYLNGCLDRPDARACFIGLAAWHALPHMIRAVFEGVALEHRRHVDQLLRGRGTPTAVRFAGGGARSRPWLEIFAAALGLPIELSEVEELGALGAAMIAAVAVGLYPDLEAAVAAMTRVKERIQPDPEKIALLARRSETHRALRDGLAPFWARL